MTEQHTRTVDTLRRALGAPSSTVRLQAALAAGTEPDPVLVADLLERCRHEPDFYVRDMLTWALTRHDDALTVPALLAELESPIPQARSQALHTLSKIGDPATWTPTANSLLTDPDDEVARSAWRLAVIVAAGPAVAEVAAALITQLGRGGIDVQRSLSRAFVEIGETALPLVRAAQRSNVPEVRAHALATEALMHDPESSFVVDVDAARRAAALGPAARLGTR
ncbi:HEAT repeat domain-containing protein [Gordonia hydrophobica]|uniref:HEAT repeat domain-containing protein n=1 Tax=Gordonia hydrophobica TaxID=40516 RepID=A0ABZ2TXA8_9ACTN|nr:HEAT repeat domain-containing protein [Gordonia hydrophobica]MBM7366323.1 HEAT repeat protein [Gordonia hydrophobica]